MYRVFLWLNGGQKRGNYDDLLCRTVAFYLVEDFLSLTDSQSSTMMVCDKELMRGGQRGYREKSRHNVDRRYKE